MEIQEMRATLEQHGFTVGARDPRVNRAFTGKFMVIEQHEDSQLPTDDARNGPWAIVGDDLDDLIEQAYDANHGGFDEK